MVVRVVYQKYPQTQISKSYQFPADVIKLVLGVSQGDLGVGQLLVKVVDRLLVGRHLQAYDDSS